MLAMFGGPNSVKHPYNPQDVTIGCEIVVQPCSPQTVSNIVLDLNTGYGNEEGTKTFDP